MIFSDITQWVSNLGLRPATTGSSAILIILLLFSLLHYFHGDSKDKDGRPPKLKETIPFLSNSIGLATDTEAFWNRAMKTMQSLNAEILRFHLGWQKVYLVVGNNKTNPHFCPSSGLTQQHFLWVLIDVMFGPSEKDGARIAADVSGRGREPAPSRILINPLGP